MQPEQQQRIMGYFIEEAKDHLNTLEQGLLNLQSTIDDPEMVNEVFRAAHSIKGGAAMLGLSSIQKTAHRLEDYFKILKETSKIKPDQKLETLLLQVFDTLQELLEHLQTPSGLTDEVASAAMTGVEPVFEELSQYFTRLEQHATNSGIAETLTSTKATKATIVQTMVGQADEQSQNHALAVIFQSDVSAQLREMLQLFRQAETLPDGRDRLQNLCQDLRDLGEAFELASWSNLLEVARQAIAYSENSYRVLAPIIIKEIKHAQNLVLLGRSQEISPSGELQALVPAETAIAVDADLASFFAMADGLESTTELDFSGFDLAGSDTSELDLIDFDLATPTPSDEAELAELSFDEMFDLSDFDSVSENGSPEPLGDSSEFSEANRHGPQVGMAELNSLADLFEGEVPDLGSTWQEEKVIHSAASAFNHTAGFSEDASDFPDLFAPSLPNESTSSSEDDLASLFGDDLLEAIDSSHSISDQTLSDQIEGFEISELSTDEMLDLGEELSTYDDAGASSSPAGSSSADSNLADSGLADLENFFNLENFDALEINDATHDELSVGELKEGGENALTSLDNLDDLFEGLGESDLNFASAANESFDGLLGADQTDNELLFNELDSEEICSESSTAAEAWLDGFDLSEAEDDLSFSVSAEIGSLLNRNSSSDQPEELSTETIADLPQQDDLASLAALSDPWSDTQAASPSNLEEIELDLFSEGPDNHDNLSEFNANLETSDAAETGEHQIDLSEDLDFGLEIAAFEASASLVESELTAEVELELDDLLDPSLDALSADESDLLVGSQDTEFNLEFDSLVDTLDEQASLNMNPDSSTDRSLDAELLGNDLSGSEGFALADLNDLLDEAATDTLSAELSEFDLDLEELGDDSLELSNSDPVAANLDESALVDFALPEANLPEIDFATTELNELFGAGGSHDVELGNTLDSADSADQLLDEFFINSFEAADLEDPEELSGLTETAAAEESADDLLTSLTNDREDSSASHDDWLGFASTGADNASTDDASLSLNDLLMSEGSVSLGEDISVADPLSEDEFLSGSEELTSETAEEIDIFGDGTPVPTLEDLDLNFGEASEVLSLPVDVQDGISTEFDMMNSSDELLSELMSSSSDDLEFEELDFAEEPSLEGAANPLDSADLDLSGFESELATNLTEDNLDLDLDLDLDDLDLLSDDLELSTGDLEGLDSDLLDGGLGDISSNNEGTEQQGFNLLNGGVAASMAGLGIALSAHHSNTENLHEEPSLSSVGDLDDLDDLNLDGLDLNDLNFNNSNLSDLDGLLEDSPLEDSNSFTTSGLDDLDSDLDLDPGSGLEGGLEEADIADDFDNLDALLSEEPATAALTTDSFADLESLLSDAPPAPANSQTAFTASDPNAEFDDLEKMLEDANQTMGGSPTVKGRNAAPIGRRATRPSKGFSEQTMRVPVKHLDNLSNLVGELVVNRNSLEQDQERLRQSLDNLLYQVQQLSDVGQRMQDLYERSLLESSLLASRQHHRTPFGTSERNSGDTSPTGVEYDPLEMDRFTGFHSLSQEMIELIVRVRESASDIEFIVDETDQVTRMFRQVTTQLQEGLTRSRMVPFAQAADRLPRAVRDIAMKCGRQAELVIEGRETLIDKMILEHLYDPLTHLVNNAISHGIESPDVRQRAGKSPVGQITICAFHQGNQTVISVSDDGAGIDIERVKTKAIEKGLITSAEALTMSRLDIYDLLFHPGFSTKDQADDFSGRGVGMDVVRTSLNEIRGAINTDSIHGKGTTFTIRLPLTLSISKALCCISDRARIAFPMDGVEDMLDIPKERIQTNAEGQASIAWRDVVLPLRPLSELLSYSRHLSRGTVYGGSQDDDMVSVVVLRSAGNYLALQVDQVLGEQEIVIKQLEGPIPKPIGVAGATVLGDGRIMPIADVLELIDLSMGRIRRDVGSMWEQDAAQGLTETVIAKTEPMVLIVDDSITVRELLSMTFNKVGYRVEQARDGQEAWEKLRSGLPCNIVFCDIEMPRMDGLELLSRIQKDPNLNSLPIAMLTSRGADRHRQMAASLGASGYFTKPYLEEALLDAAQRMLKGEVLMSSSS